MKYFLLSFLVVLLFFITNVSAHTRCKVNLGFGNWTEGCPHFHRPPESTSTLPGGPGVSTYKFTVVNERNYKQRYWIGKREYTLSPGYQRTHSHKVGGYNSSSITRYPVVEFDRYAGDGKYTAHRVQMRKSYKKCDFWKDGNKVKFGCD